MPTQLPIPRITFTSLSTCRQPSRQPDLVADAHPVHALQYEVEVEGQLQLSDHEDSWIIALEPDKVASSDLALDRIAEAFEKTFDWKIEGRLHMKSPDAS